MSRKQLTKHSYTFIYKKRRGIMQHQTIERKNTRAMMDRFYSQILKDDLVYKYYTEELAEIFKARSRAIANNFIRLLGV